MYQRNIIEYNEIFQEKESAGQTLWTLLTQWQIPSSRSKSWPMSSRLRSPTSLLSSLHCHPSYHHHHHQYRSYDVMLLWCYDVMMLCDDVMMLWCIIMTILNENDHLQARANSIQRVEEARVRPISNHYHLNLKIIIIYLKIIII